MLFVGMLAVLVGQASAEVILPRPAGDNMQDYSEQKFTKGEIKWNQQGGYGYFVTKTMVQTLHILNLAMVGAGAVVALTIISWVIKTLVRFSKMGLSSSRKVHG